MQITHDLAIGGLQKVVVNLCRTIDREVFDVSVLCLRALGTYAAEVERLGIDVALLPQKDGTDYLSFLKVARVLRAGRIDVVHTHNTQPFVDGTIGAMLSGVRTVVHTDHARDFPDKRRYMVAEWLMSQYAYRVVGVSEHTTRNLRTYERIPPRKLETIVNGIDPAPFEVELDRGRKRRELGVAPEGPVLGLAARLTEQKGIGDLLQAMPAVLARFPTTALIVAVEGPLEAELRRDAANLGLSGRVHFLGPRLDVPEILKALDLFVLPSRWEGLPIVLLEALAAGCPVVASRVGGVPGVITDGVNGTLVTPRAPSELGAAIVGLLESPNRRQSHAEAGRATFRTRFSAELMTARYERLYLREAEAR
jgi:glycosyltransferase involved in cell wall biosynthesis